MEWNTGERTIREKKTQEQSKMNGQARLVYVINFNIPTTWRWARGDVTSRFLTESDKGTDTQPTVIKSGKETERNLDFRLEDTIVASVLSSFSLSLFNVIQDLMSSIHFYIERKRSGIWWGGADFWSWKLSAFEWWRTECFSITLERGVVQRTKGTGPRTDPCGRSKEMGAGSDV